MSGERIAPLPEGYEARPFAASDAEGVRALWLAEDAVDADVAARRVHETYVVLAAPGGELAGTASAHLQHVPRLGLAMWSPEVFVAAEHRRGHGARRLLIELRDHLAALWESGEERRGHGLMVEVQNQGLRQQREAVWPSAMTFVGQNELGEPLRVFYFGGAAAPVPARSPTRFTVRGPREPAAAGARTGPVFLIGAPGSGVEGLARALAASPDLQLVDGDRALDTVPALSASRRDWADHRLGVADRDEGAGQEAARALAVDGSRALVTGHTLGLRIPFLRGLAEDPTFVYLHRDPEEALPRAAAAWESGEEAAAEAPPGWDGPPWSFALTPRWPGLRDLPLAEVVAGQWEAVTRVAVGDLQRLAVDRWAVVDHHALRRDPAGELARVAAFAGVELDDPALEDEPPAPAASDLTSALDHVADTAAVSRALFAAAPPVAPRPRGRRTRPAQATASLAQLLDALDTSLVVASSDSDRLVLCRRSGEDVHTHLLPFDRPSALVASDGLLAVGSRSGVTEYRDIPAARDRVGATVARDACFVPRRSSHTGYIDLQDLAYDEAGTAWLASARFSCLATLDESHSFVPRWKPAFVTTLGAEDRCHLNGVALDGGSPRFVTALAPTDSPRGWRSAAADDGVLIDVPSGETVVGGIARPASPRVYDGRLWLLASDAGALLTVDPATGATETVASVPGWARGLAFSGRYAFVGVSRHRDGRDSRSGVHAVDLDTGEVVAMLHLGDDVSDVSAVVALSGVRAPEIAGRDSDPALNAFLLP